MIPVPQPPPYPVLSAFTPLAVQLPCRVRSVRAVAVQARWRGEEGAMKWHRVNWFDAYATFRPIQSTAMPLCWELIDNPFMRALGNLACEGAD